MRRARFLDLDAAVGSVDLKNVVGTCHPEYGGKTWGFLLPRRGSLRGSIPESEPLQQPLKRAERNVQLLAENPQYYVDHETKENWTFLEVDGRYYIAEGNNRTVIARFFLAANNLSEIIHGVTIKRCNWRTMQKERKSWGASLKGLVRPHNTTRR